MNTGELDMLGDRILNHLAIHSDSVELDLFRSLHKLGYDHRIFLGNLSGQIQELNHLLFRMANVHRRTGQYVRRTDQDRETYFLDKRVDLFHAGKLCPTRLVDT